MLKKIIVQNFQKHHKSVLDLVPGVNMIVGDTDNGKSAIVRALAWAVFNRPQGFAFKRNDAGESAITLVKVVSDAADVVRAKGKGKNEYVLNGVSYKALRSDVPEDIAHALNLGAINFQGQFAPYFLLGESSGDVAKKLNDIVGLGDIDAVLGSLNKTGAQASMKLRMASARKDELIEKMRPLEKARSLQRRAAHLKKLNEALEGKKKRYEEAASIVTELLSLEETLTAYAGLSGLSKMAAEGIAKAMRRTAVFYAVTDARSAKNAIAARKKPPKLSSIETAMEKLSKKLSGARELDAATNEALSAVRKKTTAKMVWDDARKELERFIKKNPICPLCGADLDKNHHGHF